MQASNVNVNKVFVLSDEQAEFLNRQLPKVVGSDGTTGIFEGNRIKNSMLKEIPDLPEDVAVTVTVEVTTMLLGYEIITAPMIRELVCSVLYRINPRWRFQYTRLGMPYYNFKEKYGDVFDALTIDWQDLTKDDILREVIPKIDPYDLCDLIKMIGKDYLGVRNNINGEKRVIGHPSTMDE